MESRMLAKGNKGFGSMGMASDVNWWRRYRIMLGYEPAGDMAE